MAGSVRLGLSPRRAADSAVPIGDEGAILPLARRPSSLSRSKTQGGAGMLILMAASLLLSTFAWLFLVFFLPPDCYAPAPWNQPLNPPILPIAQDSGDSDAHNHALLDTPSYNANESTALSLSHLVFGIAGSAQLWPHRQEYVKLWWRPRVMRGHVWLEEPPPPSNVAQQAGEGEHLPPIRISEGISRFRYTNPNGNPAGIRIARIVMETVRLGLADVRWIILADDDTIFSSDNLLQILKKYDHNEYFYIGNPSESHSANTQFSHGMAFGGGGIAISYPLAQELSSMLDGCLERYPYLFGSDDRLHACLTELGVPLTKEPGFHQFDLHGDVFGLLSAHPVAPFVSVHHLDELQPFFPQMMAMDSLRLFTKAMRTEPSSFLQQCICYDLDKKSSFSISLGYVVKLYPYIYMPRELERPEITFKAWNKKDDAREFDLDTRKAVYSSCKKTLRFYLEDIRVEEGGTVTSIYKHFDDKRRSFCFFGLLSSSTVQQIQVISKPVADHWFLAPRRQCCKLMGMQGQTLRILIGACQMGKSSAY